MNDKYIVSHDKYIISHDKYIVSQDKYIVSQDKYIVSQDKYIVPYNSDNTILMYLLKFIPEISICKSILKHKKKLENMDIMKYHMERWENIAGEHYYMHDNHTNKFSYIFDGTNYIVKVDMLPRFYNLTGISYQVVELIHELIKLNRRCTENSFIEDYKYWLKHDDRLYSFLAKKIMDAMKPPEIIQLFYTKPI